MRSDLKELPKSFNVDIPYPRSEIDSKNLSYFHLLKPCYAGIISELTIAHQCQLHSSILFNNYPDISEILRGISKINILHLEILGDLLVLLGNDCGYWLLKKNKKHYWTPKFIKTLFTAEEILIEDIKIKNSAITQYKEIANKINDDTIIAIINRFILDEEYHIKLLNSLYNNYIFK